MSFCWQTAAAHRANPAQRKMTAHELRAPENPLEAGFSTGIG
jgi:hypothetical protein